MKDFVGQILLHARGAWRFRWYALLVAWAIAVIGWIVVMAMPDVYEARARVFVDTDSVLKPLLNGLAVNTDVSNRVSMMARVIMGRPNLERVARETDLSLRARNPAQFAQLVDGLSKKITLEAGNGGNIYSLRYGDQDPAMAQRVVQHLLDAFVEDTLGIKRADNGSAQQFLENQIHDYEARLRTADDRLAEFKRRNVGLMPGQSGDYYTRLQSEGTKLAELRDKLHLAEERRNELTKQLQGEEPTFGLFTSASSGSNTPSAIDGQLAEYRRQLDQLLLQYTDKHPKVIALKQTMAQLEAQQAAAASAPKPHGPPAVPKDRSEAAALALDINPVYQSLRIDLSHTEVEIAELREQVAQSEGVVSDLKSRVNTIPTIEAELTQLTRDYEVNRQQYQALLQRLESAHLSERAEASNDQVKFRVIEPAVRPLVPIGPNRVQLMTLVLLGALAAGIGLAVGLNQLRPVFLSRGMLATLTGLPVLGSISFVQNKPAGPLFRREPVLMGITGGALLVAYGVGLVLAGTLSRLLHVLMG